MSQDCSHCGSTAEERAKLPCDYESCPIHPFDDILASLSDDAIVMLGKIPGIWDAAQFLPSIVELHKHGLIEESPLTSTGSLTRVHTELGINVLGWMQLKDNPDSELPVADIMWRKEAKKREGLEWTLGKVVYLMCGEDAMTWDEVREELSGHEEAIVEEAFDTYREENEC